MSINIPTVSDHSWAVGGSHRHDYGGENVTHFCVFTSQGNCIIPSNTDYSQCVVRCFGHGFNHSAVKLTASARSVVDVYSGMSKWIDDGAVDLWSYPKNCDEMLSFQNIHCSYSGDKKQIPSFNPQGFTFSFAGSGKKGFVDGTHQTAQFNGPEDVAVDEYGVIYVADTQNHAIRVISLDGKVFTLAGKSKPGHHDGDCKNATFSFPKGLDVRHEVINGHLITVVIVADTGNHRIRRIEYNSIANPPTCVVTCNTGLCGNNYISETDYEFPAVPLTGFADGNGLVARFSAPESVAFLDGDFYVVADTGNWLIRLVIPSNGSTYTLAGHVVDGPKDPDGNPVAGCTAPCMVGHQGYRDGNLTYAEFYNPMDVTRGPNNTIWVADEQRLRIIELPQVISEFYSIRSMGRVSTIAGNSLQGHNDGLSQDSNFFYSTGVFVTPDNIAYVVDSVTCRIRRVTPFPSVAESIHCYTNAVELIRPSGCTSFDQPYDKIGRKVSRVERNIQYNYGYPYEDDIDKGKYIKNCVGSPPVDIFDKRFIDVTGDNLVIDDHRKVINEDSEAGMAILVHCPPSCTSFGSYTVQGNVWYSDISSVCIAAIHDGKLTSDGGYIQIILERLDFLNSNSTFRRGTVQHGITSVNIPSTIARVFSITLYNISNSMVHTVAGAPSAPLESGCGFKDSQPSTTAIFNSPSGISARYDFKLSDSIYLYVADTKNHRIRAISASCTQICENNARCIGPDTCECTAGWEGVDCTKPICSSVTCGSNSLCVAPNQCGCKPGYTGTNCDIALCIQTCFNGGSCTSPDTCTCPQGWFDSNCTTPVCDITCANGGNCTAPNLCSCPSEWTGPDCRTPVCEQPCLNNAYCVAPNTCICPPQWSGYDCSIPVCSQGYFQANTAETYSKLHDTRTLRNKPTYKNCDIQSWCNATNEFECDQTEMKYNIIRVPSGPEWRAITGRKIPPNQCMNIELPIDFKIPYQLLLSDNSTTGNVRYSPFSPYTSNDRNAWKGYLYNNTEGHTGPWTYEVDRQVANVNWLNITQGLYVCANGGSCIAPDVCACANGWIGFDCRTPVCNQGYYHKDQETYVSGQESENEITIFKPFMNISTDPSAYILNWPYSNPNYTIQFEFYQGPSIVTRELVKFKGIRYFGNVNFTNGVLSPIPQGGYRCSIRANTHWENQNIIFDHPNYYSRYMNQKTQVDGINYTSWMHFDWPPIHVKSRVLDQSLLNRTFVYTNQGWRRLGIWNRTSAVWEYGICVMQFERKCPDDPSKEFDLQSKIFNIKVQDTDLAFRPRISYNDHRVIHQGRWKESTGDCIDTVLRGCNNNGTCIAPNTCSCGPGWNGTDCTIPICKLPCQHNGNCTFPDICTCEKGWEGPQCQIPICAQECQNGGRCVAPDTCKCNQWPNTFRDGRIAGGRPLFQDQNGQPIASGWTGYDCAIPICTQAQGFILNVPTSSSKGFISLGGHGADALMSCTDAATSITLPRCPQFDIYVSGNDGTSFQSGCGFDPHDTGCCLLGYTSAKTKFYTCFKCDNDPLTRDITVITDHTFFCAGSASKKTGDENAKEVLLQFLDKYQNFKLCGAYHSPRSHSVEFPNDYGKAEYYINVLEPEKSSFNYRSNITSDRFLCHIGQWEQGDYIDDAGLSTMTGVGSIYGLTKGRHIRINTPNIILNPSNQEFTRGPIIRGEGIYECYNGGTCIGPDTCTCTDGYEGYDCNTPLCRHLQITGSVSGCLNGGICSKKDNCVCIQTTSVLWMVHPQISRGYTGWTGTDCSMPMCVQGFYDPFCNDLPQAPGAEGCYRCSNGGNCTAPDVCICAKGWTGFDCKTPVCEYVADPLTRTQLGTVYEDKVIGFESDPCRILSIYGWRGWKGTKYTRGNCTLPNQCTCLCKIPYNKKSCRRTGTLCDGPWQDNMVYVRNLPAARGPTYTFGSTNCYYGYEGNVDKYDRFTTCHQTIYIPKSSEKDSLLLIVIFSVLGFIVLVSYRYVSVRIKRRFLLAKIERRRSRRDSEASANSLQSGNNSIRNSSINRSSSINI